MIHFVFRGIGLWLFLMLAAAVQAQVTDNDVNRVAQKMYCPVCENIPLDECHTLACIEWKGEIRLQLAAGKSEQQIIESFVRRFGDQVVGIPQDPVLRALTALIPALAFMLALAVGAFTFARFGQGQKLTVISETAAASDAQYRQRLEQDLLDKR